MTDQPQRPKSEADLATASALANFKIQTNGEIVAEWARKMIASRWRWTPEKVDAIRGIVRDYASLQDRRAARASGEDGRRSRKRNS